VLSNTSGSLVGSVPFGLLLKLCPSCFGRSAMISTSSSSHSYPFRLPSSSSQLSSESGTSSRLRLVDFTGDAIERFESSVGY
jgi:hypothetical protein